MTDTLRRGVRQLRWPLAVVLYLCLLVVAASATWLLVAGSVDTSVTVVVPTGGFDEPSGPPATRTLARSQPCPSVFRVPGPSTRTLLEDDDGLLLVPSYLAEQEAQRAAGCAQRYRSHAVAGLTGLTLGVLAAAAALVLLRRRGALVVVDPPRPDPLAAPPAPPLIACRRCGSPCVRSSSFLRALEGSSTLCGACQAARGAHLAVLVLATSVVLLVVAVTGLVAGDRDLALTALACGLLAPMMYAQVAPHELGHALVGRAVGLRVLAINVGIGAALRSFDVGETRVTVRPVPSAGSTALLSRSTSAYRSRMWAAVAAGPAVQVLIVIGALSWRTSPSTPADVVRTMLLLSAAWILIENLIPRQVRGALGVSHTDGWQLATIPALSSARIEAKVAIDRALCTMELARRAGTRHPLPPEDLDRLARVAASGDVDAGAVWSHALLHEGRFRDAADAARAVLAAVEPESSRRVACLNMLAWCLLMAGDVEPGGEADTASADAHRRVPSAAAVCGTRGSILIELGEVERGLQLVLLAMAGDEDDGSRALNLAYVAIAHQALGDPDQARRDLATAEQADPTCALLPRVRERLGLPV